MHTFTLPSGIEIDLVEMTGVEEDLLTNRRLMRKGEGIDHVLLNCTKRLGGSDEPKMEDILDLLSGDRLFALVRLRQISLGDETVRQGADVGEHPLPRVHRVDSLLKRWLLGTYQGAAKATHLAYYLDEFTFRFNRRTSRSRGKLFYRLAQQAVAIEPVVAREIEGATRCASPHNLQWPLESCGYPQSLLWYPRN